MLLVLDITRSENSTQLIEMLDLSCGVAHSFLLSVLIIYIAVLSRC